MALVQKPLPEEGNAEQNLIPEKAFLDAGLVNA